MHHNMTIQQIQYDPSYEAERKKNDPSASYRQFHGKKTRSTYVFLSQ